MASRRHGCCGLIRDSTELPIVAMTAHALVEERERCLQAGMNDHITKPIDPDALFAAIARWTKPRGGALPVTMSGSPSRHCGT